MGLVRAARFSWKHPGGSDEGTKELRQEFEARLTELATHGLQAVEISGSLVFARALPGTPAMACHLLPER
jgi:hypothetical protein